MNIIAFEDPESESQQVIGHNQADHSSASSRCRPPQREREEDSGASAQARD